MPGFHGLDLVVVLVIALLIFGPKKLPQMGKAIGESIQQFKTGMSNITKPKEEQVSEIEELEREIALKKASLQERTASKNATPLSEELSEAAKKERQAAEKPLS